MADIYWISRPDQNSGTLCWVTSDGDVLPLTEFRIWNEIGKFESMNPEYLGQTFLIIHAVVPPETISAAVDDMGGAPTQAEMIEYLKLGNQFGGNNLTELYAKVLDLHGVDISGNDCLKGYEDGQPVYGPWLIASSMGPAV